MKFATSLALLVGAASQASAYNFWIMRALVGNGCVGAVGQPCVGTGYDQTYITQDGTEPSCVQFDNARISTDWPPQSSFSGVACGIHVHFYRGTDGSYGYYQKGGNGQELGRCYRQSPSTRFCLNLLGSTAVSGKYACDNYDQSRNGINPCTP